MMHRLLSEDEGVACLTCGAYYGSDVAAALSECTGNTGMVHGYRGERVCWHGSRGETLVSEACGDKCEHMSAADDCDCDLCN